MSWSDAESLRQEVTGLLLNAGCDRYGADKAMLWACGNCQINMLGIGAVCQMRIGIPMEGWTHNPPHVIVEAPWLMPKKNCKPEDYARWHRYDTGELCWTRPDAWQDVTKEMPKFAAAVMNKDVRVLLGYHLVADMYGDTTWQPEWPMWPHGSYLQKEEMT